MSECKVDLTKVDEYPAGQVPDEDVEVCLKVIRTLRNLALDPRAFNPGTVILLSHAHQVIYDWTKEALKEEESK